MLYKEYEKDKFADLVVDKDAEPALYNFIESSKSKARFNNYEPSDLENFAERIYELRKHNTNNTTR